jgi:protoporphyrinogen oxidase
MERAPFLVIGAGLAGLSSGIALGNDAIVLEAESRAGGLVRSECFDGFWFDHVIHLLHVQENSAEELLMGLPEHHLQRCPPTAWVETTAGTARFPLQHHLSSLEPEAIERCIRSLEVASQASAAAPSNYLEVLQQAFGEALCELFFVPYNRKMWKRPLDQITAAPTLWNLHRPSLDEVIRGARKDAEITASYNSRAFYPRPPTGADLRGMEVISAGMAGKVPDLRLQHRIEAIHPEDKSLTVTSPEGTTRIGWERALVCTMPLPVAIACCDNSSPQLRESCAQMPHNLVLSVALSIRGPRPDLGHWRYYPDPSLPFTRLIFLHEFDPEMAPQDGWPLLAEVPLPAEANHSQDDVLEDVCAAVQRCGVLGADSEIEAAHVLVANPAYVCFTDHSIAATEAASQFLREQGIEPLGRYGRWQYLSMAQVIESGLSLGRQLLQEASS